MKKNYSVFVAVLLCLNSITAQAQSEPPDERTLNNANIIFNWAEQQYFEFFPNYESIFPLNSKTIAHESGWLYRHYPVHDNYVGIYNNDVYIAGASFNPGALSPIKVFSVTDAISAVFATDRHAGRVELSGAELPFKLMHSDAVNFDIRNGGYGSAVAAHPTNRNQFYALTDRGPTAAFTGADGKGKQFLFPEFAPRIGLFELNSDGQITWLKDIILKDPQGENITGLPNSSGLGGTGEVPYDANGHTLKDAQGNTRRDDFGLDGEGLVAMQDGSFWVSDEYGPHIVHFDANGQEVARINPFISDARTRINLPVELSSRDANRGMEGLAVTPDQKTLVGIMQSTLKNPSNNVTDSKLTRIVTVNLETGLIGQYLYKQDKKQNSNSEIVALSASQFLVIERDGGMLFGGSKNASPDTQKLIYKIDLNTATNLESVPLADGLVQHDTLGLTIAGKSLEQAVLDKSWGYLEGKGIVPVQKREIVNMVSELAYPHDKMEGLWVIDAQTVGILNDDDFSLWPKAGVWEYKYINAEQTRIDTSTLYIVNDLNLSEDIN